MKFGILKKGFNIYFINDLVIGKNIMLEYTLYALIIIENIKYKNNENIIKIVRPVSFF